MDTNSALFQPKPPILRPLRVHIDLVRVRAVRRPVPEVGGWEHSLLVRPLHREGAVLNIYFLRDAAITKNSFK